MSVRMEPTLERKLQFLWMLFWHNSLPLYENTGWPKGIWHLLNGLYSVGRPTGEMRWSAFFSSWLATSVTMETWPVEHRVNDHFSKHVSPGPSFPISETCRGPLTLPIFQSVIFSFGGIWNRVFTLTNPVRWVIWRKPSVRKFVRSVVSCWPMSWTILKKKGLKTASKKTVVILPISFVKLNHLVWHVLSFNFVQIYVNLLEKQLSTVYFKDVRFPWVTLYFSLTLLAACIIHLIIIHIIILHMSST